MIPIPSSQNRERGKQKRWLLSPVQRHRISEPMVMTNTQEPMALEDCLEKLQISVHKTGKTI